MILLRDVSLIYPDKTQALIDVNLNIKPGNWYM